jgi:hypothetical protein
MLGRSGEKWTCAFILGLIKIRRTMTMKETRKACQREHDFTLVLTGINEINSDIENTLFAAGCDDATLSVRCGGVYLTFSRTAETLKEAMLSAISDVKKAQIGAEVMRVDICDLVTQADIARRIGRSRQLVHQYVTGKRGPGGFPPAVCHITEDSPLWMWCEVAYWLSQNDMIKEDVLREAQESAIINTILDLNYQRKRDPRLAQEVMEALGACN